MAQVAEAVAEDMVVERTVDPGEQDIAERESAG
jgi:hypothetical protein